jgi:hypothetical protein
VLIEVRDVATGLWLWRQPHWEWREGDDWEPEVASFVVESRREVILLDPLAPPPIEGEAVYRRLHAVPPTAVVILKPDHVRDVDLFMHWYRVKGHGPWLYWRGDAPKEQLEPVRPGVELPGGLLALDDGRGAMETPLYLPEQRAVVFADGMTAPGGVLRPWWTPAYDRVLPALRDILEFPFEHVLVSHGEPVHSRRDFEAALKREPWSKGQAAEA